MTLPNFIEFEPFNRLRRLMDAPLPNDFSSGYVINRLTRDDLDKALEGIEGVTVDDIEQVQPLPDGTLAYRDRRILLYIRDQSSYREHDPRALLPDLDSRTGFRHREWQKCWRLIKPGQKCGAK